MWVVDSKNDVLDQIIKYEIAFVFKENDNYIDLPCEFSSVPGFNEVQISCLNYPFRFGLNEFKQTTIPVVLKVWVATHRYRLPENHYFCPVSHSTPMLWLLAYPQRRMNN
ncbi:hypothetical protein T11_17499 [Trichinella zimbabwensis]|uniref:Uncharacterized protein n=1 Tax=Trichinella zimbabwensis TaxID=268475 RepID=A0A0V1GV20_9BILA|nr:hypothetical protein T11_17499 [Trichinella zimbabwensis]